MSNLILTDAKLLHQRQKMINPNLGVCVCVCCVYVCAEAKDLILVLSVGFHLITLKR